MRDDTGLVVVDLPIAEWGGRRTLELLHGAAFAAGGLALAGAVLLAAAFDGSGGVSVLALLVAALLAVLGLGAGTRVTWPWLRPAPVLRITPDAISLLDHPMLPSGIHVPAHQVAFVDLESPHTMDVPRLLLGMQRPNVALVFTAPVKVGRRRSFKGLAVRVERGDALRHAFAGWPMRRRWALT